MKQLTVISGKGGTGKTVLTASFAALAENKVMIDCDVDAADLHLLLHPSMKERHEFKSGKTAVIDNGLCKECGKCIDVCRFNAVSEDFIIDPVSCEGCGLCAHICPGDAIEMEENISGEWFISDTKYGPFVHAKLGIAEENSGKLVAKIRQAGKEIAENEDLEYVIIDGPPGIGCPVFASLTGADLAVIVTEPTLSGIHDMKRVAEVVKHFNINTKVVVNKFDLNADNTRLIEKFCEEREIEMAGYIPFSHVVSESIENAVPLVEHTEDDVSNEVINIWNNIIRN
jgi:MinD superfamily P-loop ATPase